MMLYHLWLPVLLLPGTLGLPNFLATREANKFEWTALGDSYASGVGTVEYVDGRRCLRYDQAWPVLLNGDENLAEGDHIFNNVVCSGSHYSDVEAYQLYDEDQYKQPDWQFTPRPKFGNPEMATLAIGGDDIDFPGIIFNCILDTHIIGGPSSRTCDDQRSHSWDLIKSADLADNIDSLIKMIVSKGRKGTVGDGFLLYVTGYATFFNEDDPACNDVTFARTANPIDDGEQHTKLTTDLRKDFNQMTDALNAAIVDAVNRNKDSGVKFIDIQANGALDSHRFCEAGIKEPDQQNDNLWFWHYPYNEPRDSDVESLTNASNSITNGLSTAQIGAKFPNGADYTNAIFDALGEQGLQSADGGDADAKSLWDSIGWRTKLFHPQLAFHTHIKDLVLTQYSADKSAGSQAPAAPPPPDVNKCHGIGGDHWVIHRDTAASNVQDFCNQDSKSREYNQGSVDYLRLSVDFPSDESKGPKDSPDCVGHLTAGVLDGCDGNDPVNNPHNYKFGGTLTTGSGWAFEMDPLAQQEDEDSCDVSYRFLLDFFEVRGMNWPDAKLGADGQGLEHQIKGCGALTAWSFQWTPNDVKYQWYAHGNLPIGTRHCVGDAVTTAGGSSEGNCHGRG